MNTSKPGEKYASFAAFMVGAMIATAILCALHFRWLYVIAILIQVSCIIASFKFWRKTQ